MSTHLIADRYEDLGPIGEGASGEVRRVRDVRLDRTLAMKLLRAPLVRYPAALERFADEARATAQLQHPNIVPVHDFGELPDGRVWFTMKEVRGRTLAALIAEVHAASRDHWATGPSGWTFRRTVDAFASVCHAVAYAHERGVVHRDLKPDNTMIGAHGEVYVLDWGVAKIAGRLDRAAEGGEPELVRSGRSLDHATRVGQVAGTPAYMAPEQARGEVDRVDARSDVYALGSMLYEILSGRPPYEGAARSVLAQVLAGPPAPVGRASGSSVGLPFGLTSAAQAGPPLPAELVRCCERAMARAQEDRFLSASELASAVQEWLDGSRRREQALALTERSSRALVEAQTLSASAQALRDEASRLLEGVGAWEPESRKEPAWGLRRKADAAVLAARLKQLEVDETLRAALQIDPDLPDAHASLLARARARHEGAEQARDDHGAAEARTVMELHALALPEQHPARVETSAYLEGTGSFSLLTDPPGATVRLYRQEDHYGRLLDVHDRDLGPTPLHDVPLSMGSYVAVLEHPGCDPVRYPFEIRRRDRWTGVRPGGTEPHPIWLPPAGFVGPDAVYVPAGWFRAGGDTSVPGSLPAMRLWCDAFLIQRFPVTLRRYIDFLHDRVANGREAEALNDAPRERAANPSERGGTLLLGYEEGRFFPQVDGDGDMWDLDWPVLHVDWTGARNYLAWLSEREGRGWRLPAQLEWEKAARGVDGRWHPWGDGMDPSRSCILDSHAGLRLPSVVDSFPLDVSPYGMRGAGGNIQDWCLDLFDEPLCVQDGVVGVPDPRLDAPPQALRVLRGGGWGSYADTARCAHRNRAVAGFRNALFGFRGVCRIDGR